LLLSAISVPAAASDAVTGIETLHQSPNGVVERCVRIAPIPDGEYGKDDLADEEAFCSIDLYAADVAMCPKTWSTSPGTMIYDVSEGPYAGDRVEFERNACKEGKSAKDCVFRGTWAVISRDLGRVFHGIVGSHFTNVGRLVDRVHRVSPDRFGQAVSWCSFSFACFHRLG
jgi:hypothetical protein